GLGGEGVEGRGGAHVFSPFCAVSHAQRRFIVAALRSSSRSVAVGGVADRALSSARSASSIGKAAASRAGRSCATSRAPSSGAVTAGWAFTQATARVTGCSPAARAKAPKRSASAKFSGAPKRAAYIALSWMRLPSGRALGLNLPLSSPPPRGLYGSTPRPALAAWGRISTSAWRLARLYWGCTQTIGDKPSARATPSARSACHAEKLLTAG